MDWGATLWGMGGPGRWSCVGNCSLAAESTHPEGLQNLDQGPWPLSWPRNTLGPPGME